MQPLPAIVLSCDRYHAFALHMMACYDEVWPSHPFTFHIPYQSDRVTGSRVVARSTPPGIRATVLALIESMDDEAWVYWCIDDRYPTRLVQPAVDALTSVVQRDALPDVSGIMFCRWGKMWLPDSTVPGHERRTHFGLTLLRRRDYSQIWLHQFLRVKVLRHLFERLPEAVPQAIALDPLKHEVAMPDDHSLYVVEKNLAVFGESTTRGRITRNCSRSLRRIGVDAPPGFPETDEEITMGALDP
jgi:hypothetical protein